ncbi:MAG TPA: ATP-dependent DNA helicase RecG [Terriglobales bacterium]|jgi:ATP-dependent DNA helicase RecG
MTDALSSALSRPAPAQSSSAARLSLTTEVQYLKGVGPRLGELLRSRGVATVEDLIALLPFRYEDRSQQRPIQALIEGETATVVAQVRTLNWRRTRQGMSLLELTVGDGTGTLICIWYHADYLRDRFQSGQTLALFGRVEKEPGRGRLQLRQPEFEVLDDADGRAPVSEASAAIAASTAMDASEADLGGSLKLGRIVPVYEAIGTLTAGRLRRLIHRALGELPASFPEALPATLCQRLRLPPRREALEQVHFPAPGASLAELQQARSPGHVRLILEELFCLQAGLELKRRRVRRQPGPAMAINAAVRERLKRLLPFHPTAGQKNALREIGADLGSGRPMRRLLQGDVGSGKTIVALQAAVIAIENGYQVAWMAPTQILAEQHFLYARERLRQANQGYRITLVTGATRRRAAGVAKAAIAAPQMAIGTQALLEGGFRFTRLGLVVVDEQHRFGVLQRFHLMHKGRKADAKDESTHEAAHVLVMTATPIPRTLALGLYGDLDTSTIREAPPGAPRIITRSIDAAGSRIDAVYKFVRERVRAGRQAYFIYPLIEESEALDLKPALLMFERLRQQFPELKVALLHGRLPADEKQRVMQEFRSGAAQILVSTTVVEVGVDVPNATLMVIEHAERFGIAQLHQLRGRIGRPRGPARASGGGGDGDGDEPSYCFLLHGEPLSTTARARLQALTRSQDGFELAEADLKLRGPGEFFGTRQSGAPAFQVAEPLRDQALMELAREEARAFLDHASAAEQQHLVRQIQQRWQRHYGLIEAG